ncbi:MAG TPA: Gfo/Idh/MocA family oxidoreductase [Abditibacteriaceae bacterium]|jgi:predicted dehydrogenase
MSKKGLIQCGVGGMGGTWINGPSTQSPDFDLVAIVDVVPKNLETVGEKTGLAEDRRFSSLEDALAGMKSGAFEADAVLTVTPPAVHIQHARLAFENDLHFITEKPIGASLEDAKEMVRLAREAGKQMAVSQNYRFSASAQKWRETVAAQPVGALGHGRLDFYIPGDFTGSFRETMEFPLLVDMAVHHFDLIRAITGQNIARVSTQSFSPSWNWYQHDAAANVAMELGNGMPFSYSGDWSARGRSTSWSGNWRLQCAEGSLHWDKEKIFIARGERWMKEEREEEIEIPPVEFGGLNGTLHAFAGAIESNVPAPISGEDNLQTFAAVMAAVKSAQEKRPVEIAELLGE